MHQQRHSSNEENNHVQDPQIQENTSIPPAPTATRRYNFCKGEGHYASTCEGKRKADSDLRYRMVPATNMAEIYLDLDDGPKDDPDFHLVAHVDKLIESGTPTSHASGYAPCGASSTMLQKERKE